MKISDTFRIFTANLKIIDPDFDSVALYRNNNGIGSGKSVIDKWDQH
jgi:hypothetical protein